MISDVLIILKKFFKCPPHYYLSKLITIALCFCFLYLFLYSFDPKSAIAGNCTFKANISDIKTCDGGNLLGLFVLFICSIIGGNLVSLLKVPPLLGMLLVGYILSNAPVIDVAKFINDLWSSHLKKLALSVILIRAGLNIDPHVLRKLSFVVFRLAFIPCLTEALVGSVVGRYLLHLPWSWSFIMGFVISAVSPAIIVPSIIDLEKKNLGIHKGINTLILAAASIDDIFAITGHSIATSITFSSTNNTIYDIFRGPIESFIGVSYGTIIGVILWFFPSGDNNRFTFYRSILLFLSATGAMFGCSVFRIPGAGPLAVFTLAFVASIRWKRESSWNNIRNPIILTTDLFWWILQPFLFGLIGAGLKNRSIDSKYLGYAILTICIGLIFRLLATFLVVFRTNFNYKEKLFICITWLPKATVQAAIGSIALDLAIKNNLPQDKIKYGEMILGVAIISILITAPLGATLISLTAPKLLKIDESRMNAEPKIAAQETRRLFSDSSV